MDVFAELEAQVAKTDQKLSLLAEAVERIKAIQRERLAKKKQK